MSGVWSFKPEDVEQIPDGQIKWVSSEAFASIGLDWEDESIATGAEAEGIWMSDGWNDWTWWEDEWYTPTSDGWIAYSEMKPWLEIDDLMVADPVAGKEVKDLYAAYEQKARTFREARDLVHQKGKSRGYYPLSPKGSNFGKGKSKSRPKGKKGSGMSMVVTPKGKGSNPSSPSSKPGYTGCFVCGDKGHDWRNCPKRGSSGSSSSRPAGGAIGMVEEVFMVSAPSSSAADGATGNPSPQDLQRSILAATSCSGTHHRLGFGVIDTGATETVGSLEAIEYIMSCRSKTFPGEMVGVDGSRKKRFRFGNAEERAAESYILLPQRVNGCGTNLGVYTLDVPEVPVLIGIRTMDKLGAVVNVRERYIEFTEIFPGTRIPLTRAQNGHLLINLCEDWNPKTSGEPPTDESHPAGLHVTGPCEENERCAVGSHEHADAADTRSYTMHVSVTDSKSDTASETNASPMLEDYVLQGLETQDPHRFSHPSSPTSNLDHGVLSEDHQGGSFSRAERADCEGHGDRSGWCEIEDPREVRSVRLVQSGMGRSQRLSHHPSTVLGLPQDRPIWEGITNRHKRARSMVGVPTLPATAGIRASVGSHRLSQVCTSFGLRRSQDVQEQGEGRVRPSVAEDQADRTGCCGGVCSTSFGRDPPEEGHVVRSGEEQEQGLWQGQRSEPGSQEGNQDQRSLGYQDESPQASQWHDSRDPQNRDHHESLNRDPFYRRMAGNPLNVSHDTIAEDALLSQEKKESDFAPEANVSDAEKDLIVQSLREAGERLEESLMSVDQSTCDLMEVCCGPESLLSQRVQDKGGVSFRVGLSNNMDIGTQNGLFRAREFANIVKPRWMWFSIPCGPNSPIQEMNKRNPQQVERLRQKIKKSKKEIRGAIKLAVDQISRGGHIGWEWPHNNRAWQFHEVREFLSWLDKQKFLFQTRLDGCCVGVVTHDTNEPMLKPWWICSTSPHMIQMLSLRCPGNHEHAQCQGHNRAFHSGQYPKRMCDIISKVVLEQSGSWSVDSVFGVDDIIKEETPPWDEKELKAAKEAVRKLHVNFGHPTNKALMNCLKSRGVDPRIVKLASEHRCDDCQEVHLPPPHAKVTLHDTHTLWHTLQIDIGEFPFENMKVHILVMVDEASRFMVVHELFRHPKEESRNCTSLGAVRALEQSWVQYHGLPNVLRCDPEGCFRGRILENWCDERGIHLVPCPGEDHGQIGLVEALIKKVKEDARILLRSKDCDPFSGILQVAAAHNHLDRVGGYAPSQWAYGRLPSFDNRLFEGGNDLPVHTSEAQLGTDLRANLQLRVAAEEVYRKTQAAMKISRALNSKPSKM